MPYDPEFPPRLKVPCDIGGSIWIYVSRVDPQGVVANPGYFTNGKLVGLQLGDRIQVYTVPDNKAADYFVTAYIGYAIAISALSGSGGGSSAGGGDEVTTQNIITTGTTGPTAILNSFNGWSSSDTGAKTQPIPISTGSLSIIEIADLIGTADLYPITAVPASGSIVGIGQDQVYEKFGSIRLRDTNAGWVNV